MDSCTFCQQSLGETESVVTLSSKGCEGIAEASKKRGDQIYTEPGQRVHKHCRRVYCNPNAISAFTTNNVSYGLQNRPSTTRSTVYFVVSLTHITIEEQSRT